MAETEMTQMLPRQEERGKDTKPLLRSDTQISAQEALESVTQLLGKMKTDPKSGSWHIDASISHDVDGTNALYEKIIHRTYKRRTSNLFDDSSRPHLREVEKVAADNAYAAADTDVINLLILLPYLIEAIKSQAITLKSADLNNIDNICSYLTTEAPTFKDDIRKVFEQGTTDTKDTKDEQQDTIQKTKDLGKTLKGLEKTSSFSLSLSSMWGWGREGTPQPLGGAKGSPCQISKS